MPLRAYGHFVAFAPRSSFRRESSPPAALDRRSSCTSVNCGTETIAGCAGRRDLTIRSLDARRNRTTCPSLTLSGSIRISALVQATEDCVARVLRVLRRSRQPCCLAIRPRAGDDSGPADAQRDKEHHHGSAVRRSPDRLCRRRNRRRSDARHLPLPHRLRVPVIDTPRRTFADSDGTHRRRPCNRRVLGRPDVGPRLEPVHPSPHGHGPEYVAAPIRSSRQGRSLASCVTDSWNRTYRRVPESRAAHRSLRNAEQPGRTGFRTSTVFPRLQQRHPSLGSDL